MIQAKQEDAEQELASLCGVLNQSYARLVTLVAEALSDESWAIAGVRSAEHWLTLRVGLSPTHARQVVTVARRCDELPTVMASFGDGQLSLDQVTVVARYAPAHVEASVAEFAVNASVPQLRRALSRYSFDPPAEPGHQGGTTSYSKPSDTEPAAAGEPATWNGLAPAKNRASEPAELSMSHDQWGRFTMRFSAPSDVGALVEAALKEAKDALFSAGRTEVTWGDAMAEVARRSLGAADSMSRRDSFRTYVHLDTNGGWLTGQPRMPAHITKKLTCDGVLQPVWHTQGAAVNVGRAQRIVPARTRRLVEDRDRGCRFPGCATTRHVECHHLIHWVNGGTTDTWNLCCLCDFHHDAHHDGDFTISGDPNNPSGLTFTTRHGFPIRPGPTFTTPVNPPQSTRPPGSAESLPSSGPREARESALSPGSPDAPGSAGSGSPNSPPAPQPPGKAAYHGPSGETLNLRWVTFHEPRNPALV